MLISKRVGITAVVAVFVLSVIGIVYFTWVKAPLEPVKIYKAVQPEQRQSAPKGESVPLTGEETDDTTGNNTQEHPGAEVLSEVPPSEAPAESEADFLEESLVLAEEAVEDEDVPVSPFGFGPYPEVPNGFPDHLMPIWTWSNEKKESVAGGQEDFELMHRVLIKLWNEGDHDFRGVTRSDQNGKVYPLYDNVVYVERWQEMPLPNGETGLYPAGQLSTEFFISPGDFIKNGGKLPRHIEFVNKEDVGYDPYHFLNLQ